MYSNRMVDLSSGQMIFITFIQLYWTGSIFLKICQIASHTMNNERHYAPVYNVECTFSFVRYVE